MRTPTQFELFTGGESKTPDLAIAYNIALKNIQEIIKYHEGTPKRTDKIKITKGITYNTLAEYLWKANSLARNNRGYTVTDEDRAIIDELYAKLDQIRNYHSHVWHSHEVLQFSPDLYSFINDRYERAKSEVNVKDSSAVLAYEKYVNEKKYEERRLFNNHDKKWYITPEGRIFFLSFFLNRGQMYRFLQQRAGFKRNDVPMFRVKREIYTHYCQREGASLYRFHQEGEVLQDMGAEEQKDILRIRQAYKLRSYLFDYPEFLGDPARSKLFFTNEKEELERVENIFQLLLFIEQKQLLTGLSFSAIAFATNEGIEKERTGSVTMFDEDIPDFRFEINFEKLFQLTVLCIKYGETEILGRLRGNLKKIVADRFTLYQLLLKPISEHDDTEINYLNDAANQRLRGSRKLTENGMVFFSEYGRKGRKWGAYAKQSTKLANSLRPWNAAYDDTYDKEDWIPANPENIVIYASDFIEKERQKFRQGNKFMLYCVQYLMDFEIVKNWYWETEKFELRDELRKIKEFQLSITINDFDYRISIENDHVTVGIPKVPGPLGFNEIIAKFGSNKANEKYRDQFFQFSIGPRAMLYLMTYHIRMDPKMNTGSLSNTDLGSLLTVAMKNDMHALHARLAGGSEDFVLLEDKFVPQYLKTLPTSIGTDVLGPKVEKRITTIFKDWDSITGNIAKLKRYEKNRVIMDIYRLFEWPEDNEGNMKFLRADEFNELSMCHYLLKKKDKNGKNPEFDHLFFDVFALNKRTPPIPSVIITLIRGCESLDELLVKTIAKGKEILQTEFKKLTLGDTKTKKNTRLRLCRKLGISIPKEVLQGNGRMELEAKHAVTLNFLPFAIHPILILKYFERQAYKDNYDNELAGKTGQKNNVFSIFKSPTLSQSLFALHYNEGFLENILPKDIDGKYAGELKKQQQYWKGCLTTTKSEDAVLWWVAKKYLQQNNYSKNMGVVLGDGKEKDKLMVEDTFAEEITIQLKTIPSSSNICFIKVRLHQLDDHMFTSERDKLFSCAMHYLRRHNEEKDFWEPKEIRFAGTKTDPIPYEVLREEMAVIAEHAQLFARYLLDWERIVIYEKTKGKDDKEKQLFLVSNTAKEDSGKFDYLDFIRILEWVGKDKEHVLNRYRGMALHDNIPANGSFAWMARPGSEIGTILGVTEPFNLPKDKSKYLIVKDSNTME